SIRLWRHPRPFERRTATFSPLARLWRLWRRRLWRLARLSRRADARRLRLVWLWFPQRRRRGLAAHAEWQVSRSFSPERRSLPPAYAEHPLAQDVRGPTPQHEWRAPLATRLPSFQPRAQRQRSPRSKEPLYTCWQ